MLRVKYREQGDERTVKGDGSLVSELVATLRVRKPSLQRLSHILRRAGAHSLCKFVPVRERIFLKVDANRGGPLFVLGGFEVHSGLWQHTLWDLPVRVIRRSDESVQPVEKRQVTY